MPDRLQESLRSLPSVTELLKDGTVAGWLRLYPQGLITECLRRSLVDSRQRILNGAANVSEDSILAQAGIFLRRASEPRVREAINATGIILHTGLGRAVLPEGVVDSMLGELKGYCTLGVDRDSGERAERDDLVEYILTELTGAEAATVVNNNAAATMLVLAALAAPNDVLVSRGQLIEIGGSFRLPEVMAQSGARLVEVGATNRTHLRDYQKALTGNTAAILRAHPSNYRIIGFTTEVPLRELAALCRSRRERRGSAGEMQSNPSACRQDAGNSAVDGLILIDDLGAGALIDLKPFGLPHEPTVRESIEAGADVVLFSGDKLIGAGQCGIIAGRRSLIERLRKHPLMRAVRVDKTCLMILERTLQLFRDPERLRTEHPTYRMASTPMDVLKTRAERLALLISTGGPEAVTEIRESDSFLGSGSLPTEVIPSFAVTVSVPGMDATRLARRLRLDDACIFSRIKDDCVRLDVRTLTEGQVPRVAEALKRILKAEG